jgi:hypothetical protein
MIPLTESAFWGPMAYTIMGGLFVATFLTLLSLPALYALWYSRRIKAEKPRPAFAVEELAQGEERPFLPLAAE